MKYIQVVRLCSVVMSLFMSSCVDHAALSDFIPLGLVEKSADEFTFKEIQLDPQSFVHKLIVVSGNIEKIGNYRTYLVLFDKDNRLLVDATSLHDTESLKELRVGQRVKALGKIQKQSDYIVLVSDKIELIK